MAAIRTRDLHSRMIECHEPTLPLSDGASGVYSQITFLIVWPIIAICSTPLIGLVLALLFKQTTPRELLALGRRRCDRGLIDTVLLQYAVPLTMLILLYDINLEPINTWSIY